LKRDDTSFFAAPNPERYYQKDKFYIGQVNAVYLAAMTWILYHEFAHQYYGHIGLVVTEVESKEQETAADDFCHRPTSWESG